MIKNLIGAAAIAATLALSCLPAAAQVGYGKVQTPWFPQGKVSGGISVGSSSAATLLPTLGQDAWICNTGTVDAYLAFGPSNTVTATVASSSWLKAGTCGTYDLKPFTVLNTYVAAISASSTTLTVETGIGIGPMQLASSGGGGGSTSVTQGTIPWQVSGNGTANSNTNPVYVDATSAGQLIGALTTLNTSINSPTVAGTNIIGKVGIDQTTPGVTNGVEAVITDGFGHFPVITAGAFAVFLPTTPTLANGNGIVQTQGGTVLSATNGEYANLLQGNAVLSTTNGIYANLLFGNAASATGAGATGTTTQRVGVAQDTTTIAGSAPVNGGIPVVNGASAYKAVAASQTATVLGATGAIGDYLSHCDIYPTSTSPGVVTVFDNTNAATSSAILFPGGASSLSNLVPFAIPVGAISTGGGWKVTTGASVSVVCYGKFT